jgi:methionyl aminopeptidase
MMNRAGIMPVTIKNSEEVELLRKAGRLAARTLEHVGKYVKAGVTTDELDQLTQDYILSHGAYPSPLHYRGFPKSICTSINEVICHGIPSDRKLVSGDIVNVDVTVFLNGVHGDTSAMFCVGEVSESAKKLVQTTKECLDRAIDVVSPKARLGDIGYAIQSHAESRGFSVVRDFCGHGIGREFHEDPHVLHYGRPGQGLKLKEAMVFTIEPMINEGRPEMRMLPDQWTAVTVDGKLSAQFEHMLLVTSRGYEILTLAS